MPRTGPRTEILSLRITKDQSQRHHFLTRKRSVEVAPGILPARRYVSTLYAIVLSVCPSANAATCVYTQCICISHISQIHHYMYHISSYLASKQAHRTEYIEHVSNQNSDQLLQSYCEAACIIWKFMNFYPKC